jgi:hypothetical protein
MRTLHDDARLPSGSARTLDEFAPRYERPTDGAGRRTLADVIADALGIIYQDVAEYAFVALIGAIAAAFAALLLPAAGGIAGLALMPPAVFLIATGTYAMTCAAERRAQDNLEPDAVRAFFAALVRLPAITPPLVLPLALSSVAVTAGVLAARWAPDSVVTLAAIIVFAVAGLSSFQRAMHVPALFLRDVNFEDARALGAAAMRKAGALVAACFVVAMAPTALLALLMLASGFNIALVAATAFVFVATMPLAAGIATVILDGVAPQLAAETRRTPGRPVDRSEDAHASERLTRQYAQRRR